MASRAGASPRKSACMGTCAGTTTRREIEDTYAMSRRIEAEERALDAACLVFTSTQQEVTDQWGLYDGCAAALAWGGEERAGPGALARAHIGQVGTSARKRWAARWAASN